MINFDKHFDINLLKQGLFWSLISTVIVAEFGNLHFAEVLQTKSKEIITDLSHLFDGKRSPGSTAVASAEGRLKADGSFDQTDERDPANKKLNRGFCNWNGANGLTSSQADAKCENALQRQSAQIIEGLRSRGINPESDKLAVVLGTDLYNQSDEAGAKFPEKYAMAIHRGNQDPYLSARVESFRNRAGALDASGLFRICRSQPYYQEKLAGLTPDSEQWRWQCIALDQGRRIDTIKENLHL